MVAQLACATHSEPIARLLADVRENLPTYDEGDLRLRGKLNSYQRVAEEMTKILKL